MKKVTKEVYLKWYEDMLFWRKFEDQTCRSLHPTKSERISPFVQRTGGSIGGCFARNGSY